MVLKISVLKERFQASLEFYKLLNFQPTQLQSNQTTLCHPHHIEIQLFVSEELENEVPNGTSSEQTKSLKDLIPELKNELQPLENEQNPKLCFSSPYFHRIHQQLAALNYPFQLDTSFLYLKDPNGLSIQIQHEPLASVLSEKVQPLNDEPLLEPDQATNNTQKRRRLAILTSGGDAPGMNAALRSIVRVSLVKNCEPFAVMEGYQGLVDNNIRRIYWEEVQGVLSKGGTIIGTARCMEFKEREGRLKAAKNLVQLGIDALVVIGGDGSLTGADLFRSEWKSLLEELHQRGDIQAEQLEQSQHLSIVGLVGSIDNDMATTDLTIGAVSSLHRICEAVDCISSTALSHQRAFVIEVMGRHCGWLALMASIATGADWLFIPEHPPERDWPEKMCSLLHRHREMGKRKSIIIVAEGALDLDLQPIRAEFIKDLIIKKINFDTRVTTLGHVQRGGSPAAIDRYLATIQGVHAVDAVLNATPDSEAPLIGVSNNRVTVKPLMKAVETTRAVSEAIKKKDFQTAMSLRDSEFRASFAAFSSTLGVGDEVILTPSVKKLRIAIVHCGAPAGGMNAATRAAVRTALNHGHTPLVVNNSFQGLIAGDIKEMRWMDVESWSVEGGSQLGTNRSQPRQDLGLVAYQIQKHQIHSLMLIGGFEAYTALLEMTQARSIYPSFCIPMILIPATISNNVPGTDLSLGADTALNVIIEACDRIRQSAYSSRKRVFVVEVQGGKCGYLATMAGLACGATCAYIPEIGLNLDTVAKDSQHLIRQFNQGQNQGRVILRNECVSDTYTTETITRIFKEEGKGVFDARSSILGHIQQGGAPSPTDRVRATRFAVYAVQWIEKQAQLSLQTKSEAMKKPSKSDLKEYREEKEILEEADFNQFLAQELLTDLTQNLAEQTQRIKRVDEGIYTPNSDSSVVLGVKGASVVVTNVEDLIAETDFKHRKPKSSWWLHLNGLIRVLAKYGYSEIAK